MSISITQDVRDMVFKGPMSSSDMKHYDEHLALAILKYCFDDYDNLIVKDAPDLQSPECSIGIEVTEVAISRNKAIEGDYLQYRKTNDRKYIEKIKRPFGDIRQKTANKSASLPFQETGATKKTIIIPVCTER